MDRVILLVTRPVPFPVYDVMGREAAAAAAGGEDRWVLRFMWAFARGSGFIMKPPGVIWFGLIWLFWLFWLAYLHLTRLDRHSHCDIPRLRDSGWYVGLHPSWEIKPSWCHFSHD